MIFIDGSSLSILSFHEFNVKFSPFNIHLQAFSKRNIYFVNMKKLSFLFILSLIVALHSCDTTKTGHVEEKSKYLNHVGDILYDSLLDASPTGFMPCNENYSYQYYNFESNGPQYKGERPKLVEEVISNYKVPKDSSENGYITIRFVVNCKGKSGYYRAKQLDEDYLKKSFSKELLTNLTRSVMSLNGWEIKQYKNRPMDYHQYLTFRLVNSQIISIVP